METTLLNSALSFVLAAVLLSVFAAVLAGVLYWLLSNKVGKVDAINVSDKDGNRVDGIPFYIRRSRLIHETIYMETLVNLSIRANLISYDDEGKRIGTDVFHTSSKRISLSSSLDDKIAALHADLSNAQRIDDPDEQLKKWAQIVLVFESLPSYVGMLPIDSLPVMCNIIREEPYVDYQSTYFQNAAQPVIGSANVTVELGADGTLSKTNVQIEDSTISKLIETFPTSRLLEMGPPEPEATPATEGYLLASLDLSGDRQKYDFSLDMSHSYVYHVLFQEAEDRSYISPIELSSEDSWYRREFVTRTEKERIDKSATQPNVSAEKK